MRKQTKIAAVVSAAALLALGASITSFAAAKGTWMMVDGEWYCYDKNGDAYTNTFCSSNGKEYYVGDDGQLVRSEWVEDGSDKYFVNSSGAKITNDWRLTTPYDDEVLMKSGTTSSPTVRWLLARRSLTRAKHITSTAKARCSQVG